MVNDYIKDKIYSDKNMKNIINSLQTEIVKKSVSPFSVAERLIENLKNIF